MRVKVKETQADGAAVLLPDGTEAWLRSTEWSADPHAWRAATLWLERDSEFNVVLLPGRQHGRQEVSRRAITLEHIDAAWHHDTVDFTVTDVGRTFIKGVVGDSVEAAISCQKYLDWIDSRRLSTELVDHSVLAAGDMLRARLTPLKRDAQTLELDWIGHLASLDLSLSAEIARTIAPSRALDDGFPTVSALQGVRLPSNISPVLLLDDNAGCRESIAALLTQLGVSVTSIEGREEALSLLSAISKGQDQTAQLLPFHLAVIDANLDASSNDLSGLQIAQALQQTHSCRVVLMTGELTTHKKLALYPKLQVHGYIEKPFTAEAFVQALTEAFALAEPIALDVWLGAEATRPQPYATPRNERPSDLQRLTLPVILQTLGSLAPGASLHVFEFHPRSLRARASASWGAPFNWIALRGKLAKSVIKDTAFSKTVLVQDDARSDLAHLWTSQMMTYSSFCGVPVNVPGRRIALVAFHPSVRAFGDPFQGAARLAAEQVARVSERDSLYATRANEANLASYGMALASLAHELSSDVTALSASFGALERSVSQLSSSERQDDQEPLNTLARVRATVDDIATKTRLLRGARGVSSKVSVLECLQKAAAACRAVVAETINRPERIQLSKLEAPPGDWDTIAPAASLTIVFFNLYLNAAQQIDLASSVRASGRIWTTLERVVETRRRSWIQVRIHDTGPGIHVDDWERVFEAGYSTKTNGSGLGLYIGRHLIRECGGSLSVASSRIWDGTSLLAVLPQARIERVPAR